MARWAEYASFPHLEASGRPVIKIFPVGDLNSSREMKKLAQVLLILQWILLPLGYQVRKGCLLSCPEEEVMVAVLRREGRSIGMCVGYRCCSGVLPWAVPVGRSSCCAQLTGWRAAGCRRTFNAQPSWQQSSRGTAQLGQILCVANCLWSWAFLVKPLRVLVQASS